VAHKPYKISARAAPKSNLSVLNNIPTVLKFGFNAKPIQNIERHTDAKKYTKNGYFKKNIESEYDVPYL